MSVILDQNGRPYTPSVARRRVDATLVDVTKRNWANEVGVGLTPKRLGEILRQADRGNNLDLCALATEMPERDSHLAHLIGIRSFAISTAPVRAETTKKLRKDKLAQKIAEAFQEEVIDKPNFRWMMLDLMDALMVGYSVIQPVWDTTTTPWTFKDFVHIDPRAFQFDVTTLRELRVRDYVTQDGQPLTPGLFLVHYPRIRAGLKLRGGLARLAAITWLFKTSTVADWMAFAEVYGMPLRVGTYDPVSTSEEEKAILFNALVNLGHDAACMIPNSMKISFEDARRPPSGDNLYGGLATYWDESMSKAILGHVISNSTGGAGQGPALAENSREVRQDLREADAHAVSATIWQLARQWVGLNFGPKAPVPAIKIDVEPAVNIADFTAAILPWARELQMKIPLKWLHNKLQVPMPEDGEETITAPALPGAAPGGGSSASPLDGAKRGAPLKPGKG